MKRTPAGRYDGQVEKDFDNVGALVDAYHLRGDMVARLSNELAHVRRQLERSRNENRRLRVAGRRGVVR